MGELSDFYRAARAKFDGDPAFADRARQRVVLLQAGDARTLELWRQLVDAVEALLLERLRAARRRLARRGRARRERLQRGAARRSPPSSSRKGSRSINDGALCAFPPGFTNRDGEPLPLIVRKQDGGYGYGATDLAALRYRTQTLGGTRLLYVVGAPQAQHFAMVFAVGAQAGWLDAARARRARRVRLRARRRQEDVQDARRRHGAAHGSARRGRRARRRRARDGASPDGDAAARARARAADRHRRRQVRRPRERPHQGLRVRLGPHARGRGPHGSVPAVRARAHPLDLPQAPRSRASRARQTLRSGLPSRPSASSRSSCSTSATR